jgi:Kyakuja-Dileera-Zisupton transposase
MDGNFSAEHMKHRTGEKDVPLSAGMAFMANPETYKAHLLTGKEIDQVCVWLSSQIMTSWLLRPAHAIPTRPLNRQTQAGHILMSQASVQLLATMGSLSQHLWWISRRERGTFHVPAVFHSKYLISSYRQVNMDYSLCKALSYNMEDIPVALVMYDIMCQYRVHLHERVERSPELSMSDSLELRTGIGLFHIHGHQDSCLSRYSPSYISGAKQVDGEIIETLWAPLNNISRSIRGMSLSHRQEVLDAHMNHSNWKKLVRIGEHVFNSQCI